MVRPAATHAVSHLTCYSHILCYGHSEKCVNNTANSRLEWYHQIWIAEHVDGHTHQAGSCSKQTRPAEKLCEPTMCWEGISNDETVMTRHRHIANITLNCEYFTYLHQTNTGGFVIISTIHYYYRNLAVISTCLIISTPPVWALSDFQI